MNNDELRALADQRSELERLIFQAQRTIDDIDERLRLEDGNDADDFSGAVQKLRDAGVLPKQCK